MAEQQEVLTVAEAEAGKRLDVFLAGRLVQASRSKLQKLVAAGGVLLNGKAARTKDVVQTGDTVTVMGGVAVSRPSVLTPVAMPLVVLYEDEHLIVLDKPAGLSVHPGAGDTGPTLVHGLLAHCQSLGKASVLDAEDEGAVLKAEERPGIVHRLDRDTTGAIVCAKTDQAHAALAKQFHDKTNEREYVALLDGAMADAELVVESYLHRDPRSRLKQASSTLAEHAALVAKKGHAPKSWRYAKSHFRREQVYGGRLTLASIRLFTGRTHQIRVHALVTKKPIVGDPLYHPHTQLPTSFAADVRRTVAGLTRQMLHARVLGFTHPTTGERLRFEAKLPVDMQHLLDELAPYAASSI